MVFHKSIQNKILDLKIKSSKFINEKRVKSMKGKLKKIHKLEHKKEELLKEKLRFKNEQENFKSKVKKAKQLNLTPGEKKQLQTQIDLKKKRIITIKKNLKSTEMFLGKIGKGIGKAFKEFEKEKKLRNKKAKKRK